VPLKSIYSTLKFFVSQLAFGASQPIYQSFAIQFAVAYVPFSLKGYLSSLPPPQAVKSLPSLSFLIMPIMVAFIKPQLFSLLRFLSFQS